MPKAYIDGELVDVTDQDVSDTIYQSSESKGNVIRQRRDQLLAETDWWAMSDRTMTQAEIDYRQALRDVPSQAGFPENVTWPTKP